MGAVAEEQKAHAIDAAKKKAVAQHADYDTFKKMVRHVIISFHVTEDRPEALFSWISEIKGPCCCCCCSAGVCCAPETTARPWQPGLGRWVIQQTKTRAYPSATAHA